MNSDQIKQPEVLNYKNLYKKLFADVGAFLELDANPVNYKMGYGKKHIEIAKDNLKYTYEKIKDKNNSEQTELFNG